MTWFPEIIGSIRSVELVFRYQADIRDLLKKRSDPGKIIAQDHDGCDLKKLLSYSEEFLDSAFAGMTLPLDFCFLFSRA